MSLTNLKLTILVQIFILIILYLYYNRCNLLLIDGFSDVIPRHNLKTDPVNSQCDGRCIYNLDSCALDKKIKELPNLCSRQEPVCLAHHYKKLSKDCDTKVLRKYNNATIQECIKYCNCNPICKGFSFLKDQCILKDQVCNHLETADSKPSDCHWNYYKKVAPIVTQEEETQTEELDFSQLAEMGLSEEDMDLIKLLNNTEKKIKSNNSLNEETIDKISLLKNQIDRDNKAQINQNDPRDEKIVKDGDMEQIYDIVDTSVKLLPEPLIEAQLDENEKKEMNDAIKSLADGITWAVGQLSQNEIDRIAQVVDKDGHLKGSNNLNDYEKDDYDNDNDNDNNDDIINDNEDNDDDNIDDDNYDNKIDDGMPCKKDIDCKSGKCIDNWLSQDVCAKSSASIVSGGQCRFNAQCKSGRCIKRIGRKNICAPMPAEAGSLENGEVCKFDSDCKSGRCYNFYMPGKKNRCRPKRIPRDRPSREPEEGNTTNKDKNFKTSGDAAVDIVNALKEVATASSPASPQAVQALRDMGIAAEIDGDSSSSSHGLGEGDKKKIRDFAKKGATMACSMAFPGAGPACSVAANIGVGVLGAVADRVGPVALKGVKAVAHTTMHTSSNEGFVNYVNYKKYIFLVIGIFVVLIIATFIITK